MDAFNELCQALTRFPSHLRRANALAAITFLENYQPAPDEGQVNGVTYSAGETEEEPGRLVSIAEASKITKKSRVVFYRAIRKGNLREFTDGASGKKRVRLSDAKKLGAGT